jgi:hypothetical protein
LHAFNSRNDQVKAATQKWKTASHALFNFYKLGENSYNRFQSIDAQFVGQFSKLGQEVATILGLGYPNPDDVRLTGGGVTFPAVATYLSQSYHTVAVGTEAPPTLIGSFAVPFDGGTGLGGNISFTTTLIPGGNGYSIQSVANILFGDPTVQGLTSSEVARINRQQQLLFAKLQGEQAKFRAVRKALNKYNDARFKLEIARGLKEARLLAALHAQTDSLFGTTVSAFMNNGLLINDPNDHVLTRVTVPDGANSAWGARNALYVHGLHSCDPTKYPLYNSAGLTTGAGPFSYAP